MTDRLHGRRLLRVGDVVEIRPLAEIVATLDETGRLDGMPFMPEMAAYCGQRAIVAKRAHKTCDGHGNLRWLDDTVHLEGLHCDGSAHGGCQARCLMYWKTAWLSRVARNDSGPGGQEQSSPTADLASQLARLGSTTYETSDGTVRYMCQSTEVNAATRPLPIGELKQYLWDVSSGNYTLAAFVRVMAKAVFNRYQRWSTEHLPPVLWLRGGHRLDHIQGHGVRTPKMTLDLTIGEPVRIRPRHEIEATLSKNNANRGLLFDSEDATWCGSSSAVIDRVERFVDDQTGEMIEIKSDCVMLDGVGCRGEYWRMCSRGLPTYWREIWLEREP
ncbi:hypothetical protein [Mycolicibacterium goodii]|uniref:hypothetical protein n=1 Tax=Mycolicibacterium goodii TaxID=134601 RepID=UPI00138F66C7